MPVVLVIDRTREMGSILMVLFSAFNAQSGCKKATEAALYLQVWFRKLIPTWA